MLVHSARVIAVVIAVPFIVQLIADPTGEPAGTFAISHPTGVACAGRRGASHSIGRARISASAAISIRMGGVLIASLVFSALVHGSGLTEAAPPQWVVVFIQVIIGSITGSRFAGVTAREIGSTVLQGVGWAGIMLATALLLATLAAAFVDAPLAALVLAFAPGGFPEITVLAYTIGIEVAFVVTCHAIRIVCVFLLATSLASLLGKPPDPAA